MTAVCCCLSGTASRKSGHSRQEQQLGFLRERMEEFRTAALQAKKNKDLELAKQHIRMMKVCGHEIKLLFSAPCCVFLSFEVMLDKCSGATKVFGGNLLDNAAATTTTMLLLLPLPLLPLLLLPPPSLLLTLKNHHYCYYHCCCYCHYCYHYYCHYC